MFAIGVPFAFLLLIAAASLPAQSQTYTLIHSFTGPPDGALPNTLIRDSEGNVYGTTRSGGLATCGLGSCGTVFKIDPAGNETILFSFPGGSAGSDPAAGVVLDAEGNLYGTTQGNGVINGASVIYRIDPSGNETFFEADTAEVSDLDSQVVLDPQGNLYGMAPYSGPACRGNEQGFGCGDLFKLSSKGQLTVLHKFNGSDGMEPEGGLAIDAQGNLYGTTIYGGDYSCKSAGYSYPEPGCGTVYKLDSTGKFTVLHTFHGKGDGAFAQGVILDSDGNLYGLAAEGGDITSTQIYGLGTVFKVDTSGQFSVLFTFTPETSHSFYYANLLVRDTQGNLYGLQQSNNCALGGGCLFKVDTQGNYTDLYDFPGCPSADGDDPRGVVLGSDGDFYGSMYFGGTNAFTCGDGDGTVFHLTF
jgi:uncharacterized repeat protein (TIGR03803 family)